MRRRHSKISSKCLSFRSAYLPGPPSCQYHKSNRASFLRYSVLQNFVTPLQASIGILLDHTETPVALLLDAIPPLGKQWRSHSRTRFANGMSLNYFRIFIKPCDRSFILSTHKKYHIRYHCLYLSLIFPLQEDLLLLINIFI